MSVGQEHDSGADDPDLIRLNKRSLFTPSASVAVEQHSAVPHVSRSTYGTAKVEGRLTSPNARVPEIITQRCGGITVKGHTLKSFAYTTDAVIIRNTNANAILAVYPFTGEPVITQALLTVAQMPLFVGVGGGTTTGPRVAELAMVAERQGAAGVVINAPAPAETIETTMSMVDIPVIASGGVGTLEHFAEGIIDGEADAVLAASVFHFGELTVRQVKEHMRAQGIPVRL